ncbi:CPSF A subunit region-domain-containing protein [Hysterangium stoloniferum]|nr:CPSF A subunit region-domain-containing protein [Hysterangium stoloniferum]
MRVVSTFFAPSSTSHSLKCKLDHTETDYLVVAKPDRVEVFSLQPDGAKFQCSLEVWGVISSLKTVSLKGDRMETLLITTEVPDPLVILLEYVPEENDRPCLRVCKSLSLHSHHLRPMENFEGAVVHPAGDIIIVATYIGKLKALVLRGRQRIEEFDCMITELNVLSMCFLPVSEPDTYFLAILHRDYTSTLQIVTHELSVESSDLYDASHIFSTIAISENDANTLVPIPASQNAPGGLLVLGGKNILYFGMRAAASSEKGESKTSTSKVKDRRRSSTVTPPEPCAEVAWPLSNIVSYTLIDSDGSRILLGDKFGKLSILSVQRTDIDVSLEVVRLGETSPATTLTYLNAGIIFVGSHYGDSQIVRMAPASDTLDGIQIDILDTFKNLAPIMDAILLDTDGLSQIVTCSGGNNAGSLKIVRSGAELQELATVNNMSYTKAMWPIRLNYKSEQDSILAITSLQSTRFYSVADTALGSLEELDVNAYAGFSSDASIAMCNMATVVTPTDRGEKTQYEDSQYVVQITSSEVLLVDLFSGMRASEWRGDGHIVAASVNPSQIAVALNGRKLVILMVKNGQLIELRSRFFDYGEISALTIQPYDPSQQFSNYVAVGFYESNTVCIVKTVDLMRVALLPIPLPHLPVSIILCQFGLEGKNRRKSVSSSRNYPSHLLVGLGDGNLHVYSLNFLEYDANVMDQKVIPLGSTRPVFLSSFHHSIDDVKVGEQCIVACGTVSAVLYWDNGRLKHSPLVRKGINSMCTLNSKDFPTSLVFGVISEKNGKVNKASILIGRIHELHKLHIRTIPFGLDNPVRIAHHPQLGILAVGCTRTQPHGVGESSGPSCCIKFLDDVSFEQLHHFNCDTNEEITVAKTLTLSLTDNAKTYFVIGTQYYQPGETEAQDGRILLFQARDSDGLQSARHDDGKVDFAVSHQVNGCVFALAEVKGQLAVGVNESVHILRLTAIEESDTLPPMQASGVKLIPLARWSHNYVVSNMVARGSRLYIGDAISSLSVINWNERTQALENVARDYASLWPVAIETLDPQNIIGCNNDGNLFVFNINPAVKGLEQVGNYYISDLVNGFIPGSLTSISKREGLRAEHMFFTSTGRIGVVSELDSDLSFHMTGLQRNLGHLIIGIGDIKHSKWRAPQIFRGISDTMGEATGFLDGDFLERFLDFDNGSSEMQKAMEGKSAAEKLEISSSDIVRVLEELQTLH